MIGRHWVLVTPVSGGPPVDISCLVDQVAVTHGRGDTDSQPEASSATLDLSDLVTMGPVPPAVEVGATVRVVTVFRGVEYTRFVGRVTDLAFGWDDAGPDTPDRPVGQLVATSVLAELGRRVVGDQPWPQELDGARVGRVMAAAGITLDPLYSDPGTVQLLPRDVDSQAALEVAQGAAKSAGGVVWQTLGGQVRYADALHRRNVQPALTLDACDVLVTPTWRRTTEGLINEISIGYGVEPAGGGEQPRYTATSPESIARFGRYGVTDTTELAAQADAAAMGELLLTRNAYPVWVMAALPVDVAGLDNTATQALLSLDMHSLVTLTGLPTVAGSPARAVLWVEGITETLTYGAHELELVVSGYCRTVPPPRWDDIDPGWLWDSMGAMTWDQASCVGPLVDYGRWDDVSASQRWDTLPADITWDTWAQQGG